MAPHGPGPGRRQLWTCTYCNVTINDDAPSRRQHEMGLRHKGNVQRAIGEQYDRAAAARRAAADAAREMARIEAAAQAAVGAGAAGSALKPKKAQFPTPSSAPATSSAAAYGSLLQDQLVRRQQRGEAPPGSPAALAPVGVPGEWEPVLPTASSSSATTGMRTATGTELETATATVTASGTGTGTASGTASGTALGHVAPVTQSAQAQARAGVATARVQSLKPSARAVSGGEPSERAEARAFVLAEKTAGWGAAAAEDADDELVFGSAFGQGRSSASASVSASVSAPASAAALLPRPGCASELQPPAKRARIKLEDDVGVGRRREASVKQESPETAGPHIKDEEHAPTSGQAESLVDPPIPGETAVKMEPREDMPHESLVEAEAAETSGPPPPSGGGLFKKRRAGTGRGTKKIVI